MAESESISARRPNASLSSRAVAFSCHNFTSTAATRSLVTQQPRDNTEGMARINSAETATTIHEVVTLTQERGPPASDAHNQEPSSLFEFLRTTSGWAIAFACCYPCININRKRSKSCKPAVHTPATIISPNASSSHGDSEAAVEDPQDPTGRTLIPEILERGIGCDFSALQDPVMRQQAAQFYRNSKRKPWYSKLPWVD